MAEPRDLSVKANGIAMHYREWGDPGALPLVLLHGFSAHARSWDAVARPLSGRYRVLALDWRGHGESEWTAEYSADLLLADLGAFVETLALGRVALVGHSLGGATARVFAALHPDAVNALVVVEAAPSPPAAGSSGPPAIPSPGDVVADPEEVVAFYRERYPRIAAGDLRQWVTAYVRRREDGRWTWGYDPALREAFAQGRFRSDPREAWALLRRIACATLLVRGADSGMTSRETVARVRAEIGRCISVEIPDSGHMVYLEDPGGFAGTVLDWLESERPRA